MRLGRRIEEASIERALETNKNRRAAAAAELAQARDELAALIRKGRAMTPPMEMTALCRVAGIGRERGYELLRGKVRKDRDLYANEGGKQ